MCPVLKAKRRVKMFVKKKQVQNEMNFIERLNMYWDTREGFFLFGPTF
jgi:hypothetical protein